MDRKQLKHWRARQKDWIEDVRYLRFRASRLGNEKSTEAVVMQQIADGLMSSKRMMDSLILAMSADEPAT